MKEKFDRLILLLAELLTLYQGILELSRRKRAVLTTGQAQDLEGITKQEEVLILQIGKLEKARETLVKELIASHNLNCEQLTITQIKQMADDATAERLGEITEGLNAIITELSSLNEINTQLLQQAVNFVNYNINIMARHVADPTYAPQGQQAGQANRTAQAKTFFDQKI